MKRLKLRTRVTLWFAASILTIITPVLVGVLVLEWRSMRQALDHHLEEDLEVASEMLVVRDEAVTWRTDAARDYGYDAGRRRWVEVYDDRGRVLYLRGTAADPRIRSAVTPPPPVETGYRTIRTPAGAHVRTYTARRPLGDRDAVIRVARTEDDLRDDLRDLFLLFTVIAPGSVFLAALTGHWISGRALAPLSRMAERARTITAEQLNARLPIENPDDELGQLASVFNDTFGRLQASFDRLKQFAADASHELRTPLTAIRSVGEVGLRESRDPETYQEIIGSMLEEADRLAGMVDTLLMLASWESGRVKADTQPLDLVALASDVAAQLSVLAEDRAISVVVERAAGPVMALADPTMIRQAAINVVDNAIKFNRDQGTVRLTPALRQREATLAVEDEGPGIPGDERGRVLERFYRVGGRASANTRGSGLGLSIVHWALTANHGRLEIADGVHGGTRMTLVLPRAV